MEFARELLELATDIARLHPEKTHQAGLRRAVSTAYYAIFHLLISEATSNWARPELRNSLGRCFDHGPMRSASQPHVDEMNKLLKNGSFVSLPEGDQDLYTVANAFVQAQQRRIDADYNLAKEWGALEVAAHIDSVEEAFQAWSRISQGAKAQAFLVSMLGAKDRRAGKSRPGG